MGRAGELPTGQRPMTTPVERHTENPMPSWGILPRHLRHVLRGTVVVVHASGSTKAAQSTCRQPGPGAPMPVPPVRSG